MTEQAVDIPPSGEPGEHHFKIAMIAERFLKDAAAGNGLEAAQVRLMRHDTAVFPLTGTIVATIKPAVEKNIKKGKTAEGEVMGSEEQALKRIDVLAAETAALPETQETLAKALEKDPGFGWEIPPMKIPLGATHHTLCLIEKCQKCGGQGGFSCQPCNATGRSKCQTCMGQGAIPCAFCHSTGQYKRADGQMVPCTRCPQSQGHTTCTNCNGQKTIHCKMCNGTGRVACGTCAGSGWWTTVFNVNYIAEAVFTFHRQEADPAALALADGIGLRALAVDGHAEVLYAPPTVEGAALTYALTAFFPISEAEFSAGGKSFPGQVTGLNGRITRLVPFLDPYLKPALTALAKVAEGGMTTGALLAAACKSRLVRDVLAHLPKEGKKRTYLDLVKNYSLAVSDKYARAAVQHAEIALSSLGKIPRRQGLILGVALSAGLDAAWLFTPAREHAVTLLAERNLAPHILGCDIAIGIAGWGMTVLIIKALATRAVEHVLPAGEESPFQSAGKEGLYAVPAILIAFLALALAAPVQPEWIVLLLGKFGV